MTTHANQSRLIETIVVGCLVLQLAAIGILAAVPPISRDALTHHLAVPKLYLAHGGMVELPSVVFSYFPMNLDLLYLVSLYFGWEVGAKYIHCAFGLLTALLIYRLIAGWLNRSYAWLGVLMFLTLPVIVKLSITVYVDLGLVFFSFAALFGLVRWVESGLQMRYLIVAALSTGLALGTKYNGLVVFCLLSLGVPFLSIRHCRTLVSDDQSALQLDAAAQWRALRQGVIFILVAAACFAPWALRNVYWTGNPVYPLYDAFFNRKPAAVLQSSVSDNEQMREMFNPRIDLNHFSLRRMVYHEDPLQIALIPVRIFFQGQDDNPQYFDGKLHPLLLFLPFLAFYGRRQDGPGLRLSRGFFMSFAWLFILFAFFATDMRIRYIAPAIAPLVVLSIIGLQRCVVFLRRRFERSTFSTAAGLLVIVLLMLPNLIYVHKLMRDYRPLDYLSGRIDREAYIEHFRPEYAALRFSNKNLAFDARILFVFGGNRSYYSNREIYFNNDLFKDLVTSSSGADVLRKNLKAMGYTHLLVNYPLFAQWMLPSLDKAAQKRVAELLKHQLSMLFEKNGFALYRL